MWQDLRVESMRQFPQFDELCKSTMSSFMKVEVMKHGLVWLNTVTDIKCKCFWDRHKHAYGWYVWFCKYDE